MCIFFIVQNVAINLQKIAFGVELVYGQNFNW